MADHVYSNQYILVPKAALKESGSPLAVSRRATMDLAVTLTAVPKKSTAESLSKIGLEARTFPEAPSRKAATEKGEFAVLNSLQMTTASFPGEKEVHDAKTDLADEYEFVADGPMMLPMPIPSGDQGMFRSGLALGSVQWPEVSGVAGAHEKGIRGSGVLVGILDTGIDADHDEFGDHRVVYRYVSLHPGSWDPRDIRGFDTGGHGTHVSGIVAGRSVGVAPDAQLYVASVIESETLETSLSRVLAGLDWLLGHFSTPENRNKPAIVNMSLGFPPPPPGDEQYKWRLNLMRKTLVDLKTKADVLPVMAIGNDGPGHYSFPGAFKEVVGVGAVDFDRKVTRFSGSGTPQSEGESKPNMCGYGLQVHSSIERDYDGKSIYRKLSGTSMATPYVTGIAGLYRSAKPALSAEAVEQLLHENAIDVQPGDQGGSGLVVYRD